MKETIEMLNFLAFPRSFGKQFFAVVDAQYNKLRGGLPMTLTSFSNEI